MGKILLLVVLSLLLGSNAMAAPFAYIGSTLTGTSL